MQTNILPLDIPTVDGTAGLPMKVEDLDRLTVYVHQPSSGGASFSINLQLKVQTESYGSDPDDDWIDFYTPQTPIVAPVIFTLSDGGVALTVTHVRVFRTTIGSGIAPKVLVAGRNERTQ